MGIKIKRKRVKKIRFKQSNSWHRSTHSKVVLPSKFLVFLVELIVVYWKNAVQYPDNILLCGKTPWSNFSWNKSELNSNF